MSDGAFSDENALAIDRMVEEQDSERMKMWRFQALHDHAIRGGSSPAAALEIATKAMEDEMEKEETEGQALYRRVFEATRTADANVAAMHRKRLELRSIEDEVERSGTARSKAMADLKKWIEERGQ